MDLDHLPYQDCVSLLRRNPSISFFVREALAALEKRDVLDAFRDAELIAFLAKKRMDETLQPTDASPELSSDSAHADTA